MSSLSERSPLLESMAITTTRQRKLACAAILVAEGLERLAFYSLTGNLIFFLMKEPLCWESTSASAANMICTGIMFVTGLLAGWISDSHLGRYYTLVLGFVIYIFGFAYLPVLGSSVSRVHTKNTIYKYGYGTVCDACYNETSPLLCLDIDEEHTCSTSIYLSLSLIAFGAGIVRTNLAPFGGDQVRREGTKETSRFFNLFYWSINVGSFTAFTAVVYIQQNINFSTGYIIPACALLLSFIAFTLGTPFYVRRRSQNRLFSTVLKIYMNASKVKSNKRQQAGTPPHFIDYAKLEYGGNFETDQVNDIKRLGKVCVVFAMLIPYWICYNLMFANMFLLQGMHLNLNLNANSSDECSQRDQYPHQYQNLSCNRTNAMNQTAEVSTVYDCSFKTKIPAASLAVFNLLFIILTLPLVQKLYRVLACHGVSVSIWKRMVVGMIMSSLALVAGGLLETFRLQDIKDHGINQQIIGFTAFDAASTFILYQIPQYSLLGASEVFTIVTGIEYAYMMSPQSMQGVIMGLFWAAAGVGDFTAISVPYIFSYISDIWQSPDFINCNHLDYIFYSLAVLLFIFTIIFALVGRNCDLGLNRETFERPMPQAQIPQFQHRSLNYSSLSRSSSTLTKSGPGYRSSLSL